MNDLRTYQQKNGKEDYATHTLRRGESLSEVARQYGVTLTELLGANPNLNPYYYRAGEMLRVPATSLSCCEGRLYCVKAGDTLESIAALFGISLDELLDANFILTQFALIAGQIICIPSIQAPLPPCPNGAMSVTVQEGQTFVEILIAHNVSFNALSSLNMNADLMNLQAGDELCVPPSGSHGTCLDCTATYVVQDGENLLTIANNTGVSPADLLIMNPTFLPGDFVPGQMICLP